MKLPGEAGSAMVKSVPACVRCSNHGETGGPVRGSWEKDGSDVKLEDYLDEAGEIMD